MEPISEVKEIVQKLESKLKSVKTSEYGKKETFEEFVKPLFESLGWNFATDVSKEESISQNRADYGFKINDVTRFYLTTVPLDQSLEDRELIIPLTTFAFNRGVTWGVLTNFRKIRLFMSEARGRAPAHMQFFELSSEEFLSKFEKLSYITKKSLSLNTLDSDAVYFAKKQKKTPIDQQLLEDLLDYRDRLSKNIRKNNPKLTQEQVSHSVQKIFNRFIFIRSCGDRQIEERHLQSSLNQWREEKKKRDLIEYVRNTFSYFYGRYGSSLFEKHICDNLQISNFVLEEIIEGLYQSENKAVRYDFSLISSDILGKMYENYLGTIQRKQDGAYYTPSYITNYIAENTIIPYLSKSNVTNISDLISEYTDNIKELESKIHNIKILDPACGTGEFLIRAIDILFEISKAIQNHKEKGGKYSHTGKKKKSESATYATFDKEIEYQELRTIIQNNIHGVDINEEAIEITQLNLFLKLATSSQQLLDVSKNIRIGNSLIGDKSLDLKAFDWKKTFPEKFDIVIGNPPYVNIETLNDNYKNGLKKFPCYSGHSDLLYYFYNLGIDLLKENGILGFITSRYFIEATYANKLRQFILDKCEIKKIIDLSKLSVFKNVGIHTVILTLRKSSSDDSSYFFKEVTKQQDLKNLELNQLQQADLNSNQWVIGKNDEIKIFEKINSNPNTVKLGMITEIEQGQKTGYNKAYVVDAKIISDNHLEKFFIRKLVKNSYIHEYFIQDKNKFLIFASNELTPKKAPNIIKYLGKFRDKLESRAEAKDGLYPWYRIQRPRRRELFDVDEKIIVPYRSTRNKFGYDNMQRFNDGGDIRILSNFKIEYNVKYLLGILNSKLMNFYYSFIGRKKGKVYEYFVEPLNKIPIVKPNGKKQKLITMVSQIIELKNNISSENPKTVNKIKILEESIDELVYKLYNITEEEKKIVESSL